MGGTLWGFETGTFTYHRKISHLTRVRPVPGPPLSPRAGLPRVPPSRADPRTPAGRTAKVIDVFRFKIDAKSVPEALATTILILQKFSIVLAHSRVEIPIFISRYAKNGLRTTTPIKRQF